MTFRTVVFWCHLVAGMISGLSIGIMCFTGTVLAFEKELIAWSERDARRIEAPAPGAARLTLEQMQAKVREAFPDVRPSGIVLQKDPRAAVAFSTGRSGGIYVNPFTGEARQPKSTAMSGFMHTVTDLHRTLGLHGEQSRPVGKLINGVCNLAFCMLALTGLYLWIPRVWSWRTVRPVLWFRSGLAGKARDFNWHNAIGLWTAPVLIVLTLTAIPISFRWGGTLIYKLTGTEPPTAGAGPGGPGGPSVMVPTPPAGARPLAQDALFAAAQQAVPNWTTLTLRTGAPAGRGGPDGPAARGAPPGERRPPGAVPAAEAPSAGSPARREGGRGERRPGATGSAPQAVSFTIREAGSWPRTASITLTLDPFTGAVLQRSGYSDLPAAQQVRAWTRFLHTGEAVGPMGQLVAGIACLGGVVLVWTGFALSWRRFFGRSSKAETSP